MAGTSSLPRPKHKRKRVSAAANDRDFSEAGGRSAATVVVSGRSASTGDTWRWCGAPGVLSSDPDVGLYPLFQRLKIGEIISMNAPTPRPSHIRNSNSVVYVVSAPAKSAVAPPSVGIAAIRPMRVATVSESAVARNQVPILTPTTLPIESLVTADSPTGDKQSSPVVCSRYARISQIIAIWPASFGNCAPITSAPKPSPA